jgi:hypothetical protein
MEVLKGNIIYINGGLVDFPLPRNLWLPEGKLLVLHVDEEMLVLWSLVLPEPQGDDAEGYPGTLVQCHRVALFKSRRCSPFILAGEVIDSDNPLYIVDSITP